MKKFIKRVNFNFWIVPEVCQLLHLDMGVAPPSVEGPKSAFLTNATELSRSGDSAIMNERSVAHFKFHRVNDMLGVNEKQGGYVTALTLPEVDESPFLWHENATNDITVNVGATSRTNATGNNTATAQAIAKQTKFFTLLATGPVLVSHGDAVLKDMPVTHFTDIVSSNTHIRLPANVNDMMKKRFYIELQKFREKGGELVTVEKDDVIPKITSDNFLAASGSVTAKHAFGGTYELEVMLYQDTDTLALSFSFDLPGKEDMAFIDEYNSQLLLRKELYERGQVTPPLLMKPREISLLDEESKREAEEWWLDYDRAQRILTRTAKDADLEASEYEKALVLNPDLLLSDFIAGNDVDKSPKSGSSAWSNVWEGAKDIGGGVLDLLKSWGPTGTVGAYAGLKATNAISSGKNFLPWLVVGGVALLILK